MPFLLESCWGLARYVRTGVLFEEPPFSLVEIRLYSPEIINQEFSQQIMECPVYAGFSARHWEHSSEQNM